VLIELLWALPFVTLLGCIAILPLAQKHWWEKNFVFLSCGLGLIVVLHYLFQLRNPSPLLHTAHEYFSFISLIGSLFVVSGGIHIRVKGEATPLANTLFLMVGAVLANVLGTTGASMVLIRPWLRMNKYRLTAFHVVFFIFIVSNVGGGLTPIGDPPLFLGYLKGVPFFWVMNAIWPIWLLALGILLAVFFVFDAVNFARAPRDVQAKETGRGEEWKFEGGQNVFFLLMILGSVFVNHPVFLRETIMLAAAALSYKMTSKQIHESNDFSFGPIKEVGFLFVGIFATMIPALEWLERYADQLGIHSPGQFYWGSGILSSVLDNAPTYLNFLSAALGIFAAEGGAAVHGTAGHEVAYLLAQHPIYIEAISVASVFFGAMTYIGNGPNFLVKSMADQAKVKTPSFFAYVLNFSLPILLPILAVIGWIFFRG